MKKIYILPDRDKFRKWYLDQDFTCTLTDGTSLIILKGYRFNGHSTKPFHWLFPQYDIEIAAALVHDALIDSAPWHRFTRDFIDRQYVSLMEEYSYGIRKIIMPVVVRVWGYLTKTMWGDYRGEHTTATVVIVGVNHVVV